MTTEQKTEVHEVGEIVSKIFAAAGKGETASLSQSELVVLATDVVRRKAEASEDDDLGTMPVRELLNRGLQRNAKGNLDIANGVEWAISRIEWLASALTEAGVIPSFEEYGKAKQTPDSE